jgi:hypothetical protein
MSKNLSVSVALQLAESSKEQYYSLAHAFEECDSSQCAALLHTAENQLLPSLTAASASLRSLAAAASASDGVLSAFDGVLLETKSRELGGVVDSFASLRKMISAKAALASPRAPPSASAAAATPLIDSPRAAAVDVAEDRRLSNASGKISGCGQASALK